MSEESNTTAFKRGKAAYKDGANYGTNPYTLDSEDWGLWNHGWQHGYHADERRIPVPAKPADVPTPNPPPAV